MKFEEYHIADGIKTSISKLGFKKPTDIQFKSIPPILRGEDVLAIADPHDDTFANEAGGVRTYRRNGDAWTYETALLDWDIGSYDRFGLTVDIQDGTIVVGGYGDSGTVSVFTPEPTTVSLLALGALGLLRRRRKVKR